MKNIIILVAFIFTSAFIYKPPAALASTPASAENNLNTIYEMISKEYFSNKSLCNESPKLLPEQAAEVMFNKAHELAVQQKYCQAADIYYAIRIHYPIKPYYMQATMKMLEAYFTAGDYVLVMNTANYLLEGNLNEKKHAGEVRGTLIEEDVHFLIVRSVYNKMKQVTYKANQEWTEYALGIKGDQTDKYISNLSIESFIQKFPDSNNSVLAKKWLQEARNQLAKHNVYIGHTYFERRNYVAALSRYNIVNQWGVSVEPFGESMYYSISALHELSYEILDPKLMNDRAIRELAHLKENETIDRKSLSEKTIKKANDLAVLLQKALPESSWAIRSKSISRQTFTF
ncbi:MAG: outer membrane protein assembly factor BamD [Oligoflexia bacterium]|nr:outer membrane protein assembly factor BamD [Oligoflexia bacterium]